MSDNFNKTACEYCGTPLPEGVDRTTRRIRSAHFQSCRAAIHARELRLVAKESAKEHAKFERLSQAGFSDSQIQALLSIFEAKP